MCDEYNKKKEKNLTTAAAEFEDLKRDCNCPWHQNKWLLQLLQIE